MTSSSMVTKNSVPLLLCMPRPVRGTDTPPYTSTDDLLRSLFKAWLLDPALLHCLPCCEIFPSSSTASFPLFPRRPRVSLHISDSFSFTSLIPIPRYMIPPVQVRPLARFRQDAAMVSRADGHVLAFRFHFVHLHTLGTRHWS